MTEKDGNAARNLRLMADAIDNGMMHSMAVATFGQCDDPHCDEQHAGTMIWIGDTDNLGGQPLALVAATKLLCDEVSDRYRQTYETGAYGKLRAVDPDHGE